MIDQSLGYLGSALPASKVGKVALALGLVVSTWLAYDREALRYLQGYLDLKDPVTNYLATDAADPSPLAALRLLELPTGSTSSLRLASRAPRTAGWRRR